MADVERVKRSYRGHDIEVSREESLGGELLLFYGVFRQLDGFECTSGFSYGDETPAQFADLLQERIDAELLEADPWMESELP